MLEYHYNDGGRAAAGFRGKTGDCLVRAVAIATGLPYRDVYHTVSSTMKKHGYRASGNVYLQTQELRKPGMLRVGAVQRLVLKDYGFVKVSLPPGPRPTYTQAFQQFGTCIVSTNGHVATLMDGALQDTFDGRTYDYPTVAGERKARSVWVQVSRRSETSQRSSSQCRMSWEENAMPAKDQGSIEEVRTLFPVPGLVKHPERSSEPELTPPRRQRRKAKETPGQLKFKLMEETDETSRQMNTGGIEQRRSPGYEGP